MGDDKLVNYTELQPNKWLIFFGIYQQFSEKPAHFSSKLNWIHKTSNLELRSEHWESCPSEGTDTVPKVIDFPRYNMKCGEENVILRGIFHVVQYLFFLYSSCYITEIWITEEWRRRMNIAGELRTSYWLTSNEKTTFVMAAINRNSAAKTTSVQYM